VLGKARHTAIIAVGWFFDAIEGGVRDQNVDEHAQVQHCELDTSDTRVGRVAIAKSCIGLALIDSALLFQGSYGVVDVHDSGAARHGPHKS
jgi:hypothetical protein